MELSFIKQEQLEFLREGKYILDNETPQQRFEEIVEGIRRYEASYSEGLADRLKVWLDKNYITLSTPALTNFGRKHKGRNTIPLPASCNIVTVNDSIQDIYYSFGEIAMLSKLGAGVGTDFQNVCDKGTELSEGFYSNSKLDWIEDGVRTAQKVSQGASRRGYNTPFINIDDPDFEGLMKRIDKTNPDKNDPLINNTIGIILPTGFDSRIKTDKVLQGRYLKVLQARMKTGKIYLLHEDNCNKNSSPVYKALGMSVKTTNICTEFLQPLFEDMTSVCVISALNLVHWDEIKKNPQIIKDAIMMLDIFNEEYIRLTEGVPFLEKARKGAMEKRDIGLGTLGYAEYLQMNMCAYGDAMSVLLTEQIYSTIRKYAEEATLEMAEKLGPAPICKKAGLNRRNASLMMIAPNKSSSFINGATSLGIEPFMSNIFLKTLAKIQETYKNPHLEKLLEEKGKNTTEVWRSIEENNGSVQHLDFLDKEEKDVFKTFTEISPKDIIYLAGIRQKYIDMGQSLNLVVRKNYTLQDMVEIHKYAWEQGIKTLYYAYPSAHAALEKEGEKWDTCSSCAD